MPYLAQPGLLLLALAVPPLVWWWLRRPRAALRHPDAALLHELPPVRARSARVGGALLRGAGLFALTLALAGPRWPDLKTRIEAEGVAVMMVLDVSGSMAERDFDWHGERISRLDAARRAFRLLVAGGPAPDGALNFEGRPTDLVGLVVFGTHPDCVCPLTLTHSALLKVLDAQQPRRVPGESETNISDALTLGLQRLHAAGPRRKVLVLLTDGEHNVERPESRWTPRQAASIAAGLNIPIYAIDAGGEGGEALEGRATATAPGYTRTAALESLSELARVANGRCFSARDSAALLDACRAIDHQVRTPTPSFQYRRWHEGYPWLGLMAFAFLAAAIGLDLTLWRRVP
jgi:Ca-activated chloride channel family protein